MEVRPLRSSFVIMLCAHPRAVAGSSQTLFPILLFPFEEVMRGVMAITSREGVGDNMMV